MVFFFQYGKLCASWPQGNVSGNVSGIKPKSDTYLIFQEIAIKSLKELTIKFIRKLHILDYVMFGGFRVLIII